MFWGLLQDLLRVRGTVGITMGHNSVLMCIKYKRELKELNTQICSAMALNWNFVESHNYPSKASIKTHSLLIPKHYTTSSNQKLADT
eukprot:3342549-Amphidinium_carterae.1